MKVPNCPKNLVSCQRHCPMYPCWAYDQHMSKLDKEKKQTNQGWE